MPIAVNINMHSVDAGEFPGDKKAIVIGWTNRGVQMVVWNPKPKMFFHFPAYMMPAPIHFWCWPIDLGITRDFSDHWILSGKDK